MMISFPSIARPPSTALIALLLVTVARMTFAPPRAVSASATFWVRLSM